jgi:rubrerythrin
VGISISDLRSGRESDQTLENLLTALSLNLELRARYRVFEFEASQEGHDEVAQLFAELRRLEQQQIAELLAGLRTRLGAEFETEKELA